MKSITLQDLPRLQYQNQFTATAPLIAKDRIYYVTRVRAAGAWTIIGRSNSQDPEDRVRSVQGTGTEQFLLPLCFDSIVSMAGVTDILGFWVPATEF